ncbi:AsnC family transcriptional regulator [Thermoplasmatales archaeon SW_10_69_26]|nr:MAG: AsnC family transcriptional regulator [Thermoplasmatales archaeon SW_10_69_26]
MTEAEIDHELDETDRQILASLNEDARKSYRDIASELDIALSTVSSRVNQLEEAGVIQGYMPLVDPLALGYEMTAVISVKISRGKLIEVQDDLAERANVFGVYDVTGEFDSVVLARFSSRMTLNDFVKNVLAHPDVEHTTTHLVLNTIKEEHRVPVEIEAEAGSD